MNPIAEEIFSYFGQTENLSEDELMHYGIKFRSGRYPYGSGEDPYQHGQDFLGRIDELKKSGFTYVDNEGKSWTGDNAIAKSMGLNTSEYRRQVSWANYEVRLRNIETAKRLQEKEGMGPTAIGKKMGVSESTVRGWLKDNSDEKMQQTAALVNLLGKELEEKGMIDVGVGIERELGVSRERLNVALDYLQKAEDCHVYGGGISQLVNKQQTNQLVLTRPEFQAKDIYDFDKVKSINEYASHDGGQTFDKFVYPKSMDSKRLKILLGDEIGPDGTKGSDKDGIIEIRPGVEDLSLGNSRYAQVRILVDDKKYLKGMAVYSDNLPDGVDVLFNSNKTSYEKALKNIGDDPDNPFGSLIKPGGQSYYTDKNGNKQLSLINKPREEGDWEDWADALPSQFLSKQSQSMAKKQLGIKMADKKAEYDEIMALNNPTIKKHLLEKFADSCDSEAVHLKAAALPGQQYHVIIPINTLKDNEVYAPNYQDGSKLALIRYPHGGQFEIPILTVNNKHAPARKLLGTDVIDAVGINKFNAERLSGADFDGDTVMCIPTHDRGGKVRIQNKDQLEALRGFDPQLEYKGEERIGKDGKARYYHNGVEYPIMKNKGTEMGKISNLITDMTLLGANDEELARAVRHSMVVIDAEKHKLDYKRSYVEHDIKSLEKMYQPKPDGRSGGAGTIISKAKGQYPADKRQGSYKVNIKGDPDYDPTRPEGAKLWKKSDDLFYPDRTYDKETGLSTIRTSEGKKITYNVKDKDEYAKYNPTKRVDPDTGLVTYTSPDGSITYRTKTRTQQSTKMAETDDAYTLISKAKHPMEIIYADYANGMKDLGNQARISMVKTPNLQQNKEAKTKYKDEVKSLENKLNSALLNAPIERAVLRKANIEVNAKKAEYKAKNGTDMKGDDVRKISTQAIKKYRNELGAVARRNRNIEITDREWDAIQAGAVSDTTLKKILNNTDIDKLRERATPKPANNSLSTSQISRMKAMSGSYTLQQIADKFGISPSAVSKYLKGGN